MANNPTREEHLAWCKQRALEYVDLGDCEQAFASMASDLKKHPETANHSRIDLSMLLNDLNTPHKMRAYILGFN